MNKGEAIPDNKIVKKTSHYLSTATSKSSVRTPEPRQEKLASRLVSSLASWTDDKYLNKQEASREIQLKSTESQLY